MPPCPFKYGLVCLSLFITLGSAQSQTNWQRFPGNPIIPLGSGNPPFDQTFSPSVLYDSANGIYKMWFSSVLVGGSTWNVSYATSVNGTTWEVFGGSPVLHVGSSGSFDSQWVIDPFVLRVGGEYKMYYTGYDGTRWQTGLATSLDGLTWTKYSGNPIIRVTPGLWESVGANCPKVYFSGSMYTMMYSGHDGSNYSVGIATSTDGVTFTKYPANPVLRKGAPSEWDAHSVFMNSFVYYNGKFYLLYNGGPYAPVGFATSTDGGVSWAKYPGNPVFTTGPSGSWDESRVTIGSLIVNESGFRYWYTGYSSSRGKWQLGYATGSIAPPIVTSDTAGYWRMDETTGSLVSDSSPHHNNANTVGTTIVPGKFGNARSFNGTSDYAIINDPSNGSLDFNSNQSFTIEAWFNTTDTRGFLLRKGLAPAPGYNLLIDNGQIGAEIGNREDGLPPDTVLRIRSTGTFNDGVWHKVTFVRDRSQQRVYLYVDNVLATEPVNDPILFSLENGRPLTFGKWETPGYETYFSGVIDEVCILRRAQHPTAAMSDTVALWRMDEQSGSQVLDSSPNGNHGFANGTTIEPGHSGNARGFDGISNSVHVQNPINGSFNFHSTQSFTIQVWFKTTQLDTGEIIRRGLAPLPGFALRILDGHVQGIIGVQEPYIRITSTGSQYNDDQWHVATLIRDRSLSRVFLYVDGLQAAPPLDDNMQAAISNDRPLTMGRWETSARPTFYHGLIDEVSIFRGARYPEGLLLPDIDVAPVDVDFGPVLVGVTVTRTVEISNHGGGDPLVIAGITSTNSLFTSDTDSLVLPSGQTHVIHVSYTPSAAAPDTGSLAIASNDPDEPIVHVLLSGRGYQAGAAPVITRVSDVPNDQGRQVRVIWYRSIFDATGDSVRITTYGVWRRVDDPSTLAPPQGVTPGTPFSINGHTLVVSANELWDFVATIPAVQFEQYAYVAPTLYDSTHFQGMHWSVFKVSAHANNGGFYFSDPDSGYSADNIPPSPPFNLNGTFNGGAVLLAWDISPDPDLSHYTVHRSTVQNFIPDATTAIGSPRVNSFADISPGSTPAVYYRVVSLDSAGNQSAFSAVASVLLTGNGGGNFIPEVFALHQNYPNPFNPETIISYDVPVSSHVTLAIFDVNGKEVDRLVNGFVQPGRHFVTWTPRAVASGVYLCRMIAGGTSFTQKLVILK